MKNAIYISTAVLAAIVLSALIPGSVRAGFRIVIMQDSRGDAEKFRPLLGYLKNNGVEASFVGVRTYPQAAELFAEGSADGMFSGSGVAGCMIIKDLAYPVVRPVSREGWSTYWAVVIGPKGSRRFTQDARYFDGKKVIFCSLASSGEFYFRSIVGKREGTAEILTAASHGAALDALSRGAADIAIVKNRVWDRFKPGYPGLIRLGEDPGENPDGTLIVSRKAEPAIVKKLTSALLHLSYDTSPASRSVKEKLDISGFIPTSLENFKFTLPLLEKAGVDRDFDFTFGSLQPQ